LLGAHLDLVAGVGFDDLRLVAAFTALELVAALVKSPGFRIFAWVLEGLAEREAEMKAVAIAGFESHQGVDLFTRA
jgi:hypothetical protein